jgi:hypothetical protein
MLEPYSVLPKSYLQDTNSDKTQGISHCLQCTPVYTHPNIPHLSPRILHLNIEHCAPTPRIMSNASPDIVEVVLQLYSLRIPLQIQTRHNKNN